MIGDLLLIILGVAICYTYYYFKEVKKKKDKLQDWKPHE
tara:strand:- start:122 stop:238 length:117 start_codon:yes stop_codon:yes gene_type:complete